MEHQTSGRAGDGVPQQPAASTSCSRRRGGDNGEPPLSRDQLNSVHEELEKLNIATDVINRLECELDSARADFRDTQQRWGQKLERLRKKLGQCIAKSRPYYEARLQARRVAEAGQAAAIGFERAVSMHQVAKQQVALTQESLARQAGHAAVDAACLEVLNHHVHRVNEAERERVQMEERHRLVSAAVAQANQRVLALENECSRAIKKSRSYFDARLEFTRVLEEQKAAILRLESEIRQKKADYTQSLRNLEHISERIHLERRESARNAGGGGQRPVKTHVRRASSSSALDLDVAAALTAATADGGGDKTGTGGSDPPSAGSGSGRQPQHSQLGRKRSVSESVAVGLSLQDLARLGLDPPGLNGPASPDAAALNVLAGELSDGRGGRQLFSERLMSVLAGRRGLSTGDSNVFTFSPDQLDLTYRTNPEAVRSHEHGSVSDGEGSSKCAPNAEQTQSSSDTPARLSPSPSAVRSPTGSASNCSVAGGSGGGGGGDRRSVASSGVSSMGDEQLAGMIRSHTQMIQEIDELAERAKCRAQTLPTAASAGGGEKVDDALASTLPPAPDVD